jgi:hypothetical protein
MITPINPGDVFIGTYRTVWLEDNNIHVAAELTVQRHRVNNNIYEVFWRTPNTNTLIFEGTAMNFENLLIGTYWS